MTPFSDRFRTGPGLCHDIGVDVSHSGAMESLEFDNELNELLRVLGELIDLLRDHGEPDWAARLDRDRRLITERHVDAYGHVLSVFGGATGLAGFAFDAERHDIDPDKLRTVNDRVRTLRGAIVEKATLLGRELGLKV